MITIEIKYDIYIIIDSTGFTVFIVWRLQIKPNAEHISGSTAISYTVHGQWLLRFSSITYDGRLSINRNLRNLAKSLIHQRFRSRERPNRRDSTAGIFVDVCTNTGVDKFFSAKEFGMGLRIRKNAQARTYTYARLKLCTNSYSFFSFFSFSVTLYMANYVYETGRVSLRVYDCVSYNICDWTEITFSFNDRYITCIVKILPSTSTYRCD